MNLIKIIEQEYSKLGGGAFGKVYKKRDQSGNYVAHKITRDYKEAIFSQLLKIKGNDFKTFPKIHKVYSDEGKNRFLIIREYVDQLKKPTEIAKIDANIYKIRSYVNTGNRISLRDIENSGLSNDFIEFLKELHKEYKSLGSKHFLDIHSGNIGIKENGEYVLFDY